MHKVFFVRHGQSEWNVLNKICGATDIPLTAKGREQAVMTAAKILEENISFDKILYSPLVRASETARHISEITGVEAVCEERLREQNFGKYEGTERNGKEFHEAKKNFICSYDGGESMFKMAQRIYNLLDEIKKDRETTYMLVAHNGIARFINSYFYEMSNEEFASFGVDNCTVVAYDFGEE